MAKTICDVIDHIQATVLLRQSLLAARQHFNICQMVEKVEFLQGMRRTRAAFDEHASILRGHIVKSGEIEADQRVSGSDLK